MVIQLQLLPRCVRQFLNDVFGRYPGGIWLDRGCSYCEPEVRLSSLSSFQEQLGRAAVEVTPCEMLLGEMIDFGVLPLMMLLHCLHPRSREADI